MKRTATTTASSPPWPATWLVDTTMTINGRAITPGTQLTIKGQRGKFTFVRHVLNTASGAEWIDVFPADPGHRQYRAFRPGQVKTVHRRPA